jgi:hypothetical protein
MIGLPSLKSINSYHVFVNVIPYMRINELFKLELLGNPDLNSLIHDLVTDMYIENFKITQNEDKLHKLPSVKIQIFYLSKALTKNIQHRQDVLLFAITQGYLNYVKLQIEFELKIILKPILISKQRNLFTDICLLEYGISDLDNLLLNDEAYMSNETLDFVIKNSIMKTNKTADRSSPILLACHSGNKQLVEFCLLNGSNPFSFNKYGENSIFYLIKQNYYDILEMILNNIYTQRRISNPHICNLRKADLLNKNEFGKNIFDIIYCIRDVKICLEFLSMLKEKICNQINEIEYSRLSHLSYQLNNSKKAKLLLEYFKLNNIKVDFFYKDELNNSSLYYSVIHQNIELFELIHIHCEPTVFQDLLLKKMIQGKDLLYLICKNSSFNHIQYIINKKIHVSLNICQENGKSYLYSLLKSENYKCFSLFFSNIYHLEDLINLSTSSLNLLSILKKSKNKEYLKNMKEFLYKSCEQEFFSSKRDTSNLNRLLMKMKETFQSDNFFIFLESFIRSLIKQKTTLFDSSLNPANLFNRHKIKLQIMKERNKENKIKNVSELKKTKIQKKYLNSDIINLINDCCIMEETNFLGSELNNESSNEDIVIKEDISESYTILPLTNKKASHDQNNKFTNDEVKDSSITDQNNSLLRESWENSLCVKEEYNEQSLHISTNEVLPESNIQNNQIFENSQNDTYGITNIVIEDEFEDID